jgi:hypothetical protein
VAIVAGSHHPNIGNRARRLAMSSTRDVPHGDADQRESIDHETALSHDRVHVVTKDGEVRPLEPRRDIRTPAAPAAATPTSTTVESTDSSASRIINQVQEGMRVIDANGEELGRVDHIRMGDPEAATVDTAQPGDEGLLGAFFGDAEPDVPEPLRSRLLRSGYVKIDGKGWLGTDRYVTPDAIGNVAGETVTLTIGKDHLLTEM